MLVNHFGREAWTLAMDLRSWSTFARVSQSRSMTPSASQLMALACSTCKAFAGCRWVPSSARFAALGQHPRSTGCLQVYQLQGNELKLAAEVEKPAGFKCGTFGASSLQQRSLATGNFKGQLQVWDLERLSAPTFEAQAHASLVNMMDGCGGQAAGHGPPELVTCGQDGAVRVWDVRQRDAPVAAFEPEASDKARDCWTVAFGNSFNDEERCVLAGYDNGDIKMFDLRTNTVRWEGNVGNGVCGVQFDRPDIPMNKFVVTCLESTFHVFDARTQHPKQGFASLVERVPHGATLWKSAHLPQNREVCMVTAGDGRCSLFKYSYPDQRSVQDANGVDKGVPGTVQLLASKEVSTQPVVAFDWSSDKEGLFCCGAYDQCVRVGFVTKLNTVG